LQIGIAFNFSYFLISQLNLFALPQKGSFRMLPLFKGDNKSNTIVSSTIMLLI